MYYNNRGNQQIYGTGCSLFGCIIGLLILGLIIRESMFFFFRYFWLILLLGIIVWAYRRFIGKDQPSARNRENQQKQNWHRDYENRRDTSYNNMDRDFEEVDDTDSDSKNNEDEDFNDF